MIYVISNPISGRGKGKIYEDKVRGLLEASGREFRVYASEYRKHCIELSKLVCSTGNCELLIAIGGDGTFNEILSGISPEIPVVFIPAGTGNDFVKGAELPENPEDALSLIFSGEVRECDYLEVNGRRCINVAGTGFDVKVLLAENKIRKIFPGKISYMLALLKSLLWFRFTAISVSVDGGESITKPVMLVAAANGKYYGGGMPISPGSECNDGLIDLIVINKLPRLLIPYLLIKFLNGKLLTLTKYVEVFKCRQVEISVLEKLPVNIDGELADENPVCIKIKENGLKAVYPVNTAKRREKLESKL